jgi:hypothetical protein
MSPSAGLIFSDSYICGLAICQIFNFIWFFSNLPFFKRDPHMDSPEAIWVNHSLKTTHAINNNKISIFILVGFGRACAPARCAHPSFWAYKHAKRALRAPPRSFAAPPKIEKKLFPETKCFPSGPKTRAARGVYLFTGLSYTLLSYIASY